MHCVRRFGGLPVVVSALIALSFPRADNSRRFLAVIRIETGRSAMVEVPVTDWLLRKFRYSESRPNDLCSTIAIESMMIVFR